MIGILCEKPSAARNFAKALGGMSGSFNNEQYVIVPARGHLYEFVDPDKIVPESLADRYKSWDLNNLPWNETVFTWRRKKGKDVDDAIKKIKETFAKCDELVAAGDWDPSGEGFLISWEIFEELKFTNKKISRMEFVDESEKEIQKAFKTRKTISDPWKYHELLKANLRSKWDYLSMQWSRVATKAAGSQIVLRQGRLKSAMIVLVGDQLKAVSEYKKVPFYQNRFKDENGVVYTDPEEPQYKTKEEVPNKYHSSDVVLDKKEMKSTPPKKLLDLSALSAILATKGFKAKVVLEVTQKLYESGAVSYPRTEDHEITPEQFNEMLPLVDKIADLVGVDKSLLTHRTPRKTHVKTGGSHGANRPGLNVPKTLDDLDEKYGKGAKEIYELLAKSFLAMFAEDYEYEAQQGHVKDYPKFIGKTQVPKVMGWKAVFNADAEEDEETTKGIGTKADPFVHEGFPPKPQTPTMKWLMKKLAQEDIGTGATRTSTIAEISNDKLKTQIFIENKGKLTFAPCGEASYHILPGTYIGDLKITKKVQDQMNACAKGEGTAEQYLAEIKDMIKHDIEVMKKNAGKVQEAVGDKLIQAPKEKYTGTWNGKEVSFTRSYSGTRFTDEQCEELLQGKEIKLMGVKSQKTGKTYNIKGKLANLEYKGKAYVGFENTGYINDDGSDQVKKEINMDEYCVGTWKKKQIKFKKVFSGRTFTDEECQKLLNGEEIEFEAISKKTGKPYPVKGKLANQTYNGAKYVGFKPNF